MGKYDAARKLITQVVGMRVDDAQQLISQARVKYRFLVLEGRPTGPNTDSIHGVLLLEAGEDDIITKATLGLADRRASAQEKASKGAMMLNKKQTDFAEAVVRLALDMNISYGSAAYVFGDIIRNMADFAASKGADPADAITHYIALFELGLNNEPLPPPPAH